jgi:hypothetical protein
VDNRLTIFTPRVLLVHDDDGQLPLSHEELAAYDQAKRRISRAQVYAAQSFQWLKCAFAQLFFAHGH